MSLKSKNQATQSAQRGTAASLSGRGKTPAGARKQATRSVSRSSASH